MTSTLRAVDEHRIGALLQGSQKVRLGEEQTGVDLPLYENALSGLYIPLRFREQTIAIRN